MMLLPFTLDLDKDILANLAVLPVSQTLWVNNCAIQTWQIMEIRLSKIVNLMLVSNSTDSTVTHALAEFQLIILVILELKLSKTVNIELISSCTDFTVTLALTEARLTILVNSVYCLKPSSSQGYQPNSVLGRQKKQPS